METPFPGAFMVKSQCDSLVRPRLQPRLQTRLQPVARRGRTVGCTGCHDCYDPDIGQMSQDVLSREDINDKW
jgi:hypothetical protein